MLAIARGARDSRLYSQSQFTLWPVEQLRRKPHQLLVALATLVHNGYVTLSYTRRFSMSKSKLRKTVRCSVCRGTGRVGEQICSVCEGSGELPVKPKRKKK